MDLNRHPAGDRIRRCRASYAVARHPDGLYDPLVIAKLTSETAKLEAVADESHGRAAGDGAAEWMDVDNTKRDELEEARVTRDVIARDELTAIVGHLDGRVAGRATHGVAENEGRGVPMGTEEDVIDTAEEEAERLRCRREANAVHRQWRTAL